MSTPPSRAAIATANAVTAAPTSRTWPRTCLRGLAIRGGGSPGRDQGRGRYVDDVIGRELEGVARAVERRRQRSHTPAAC
jgi:hypothetical protein